MTDKVRALPEDQFVELWNAADSLEEAVRKIRALVGMPCPRWAVMARAAVLREGGADVKRLPVPAPKAAA